MRKLLAILAGLLFAGYLLTGVTEVRPGERAVVRRFGRVLDVQPEPGLWIGLPWGMDRVDRVPIDLVRRVEVGYRPSGDDVPSPPGQLLTGDHNLVNVQVVLNCSVQPGRVVDYVLHEDRAESLVARLAEAALAEWVASRTIDEVLLRGKVDLPLQLVAEVQERLAPYEIGVDVRDASVAHLLPPIEVKGAFDAVTQAQTEIQTRLYNAEQEAERLLRSARAEIYRLRQSAPAYANEQRLLALADAEAFEKRRQQYDRARQRNPDALAGIWWEEMGKLYGKLREGGRVDLLDNRLGSEGLDITIVTPPRKK